MQFTEISLPFLGKNFVVNPPKTFTVWGLTFKIYGILIAVGFLLAMFYCFYRTKDFGIDPDDFIDALIFAVPSSIIGARLYYVIFNFDAFRGNLFKILQIWEGGIAIYGGIIGAIIAAYFVCRHKKISFGAMLDLASPGFLIGQCIGRWGNFINREAYGRMTDSFFKMGLKNPIYGNFLYFHPTFLYESVWNLLGFLILHEYSRRARRKFDGQIFLLYVVWYGTGRAMIEGLRMDSLYLFSTGIRVSQLLAVLSALTALVFIYLLSKRAEESEKPLWADLVQSRLLAGTEDEDVDSYQDDEDDTDGADDITDSGKLPVSDEAQDKISNSTEAVTAGEEPDFPDPVSEEPDAEDGDSGEYPGDEAESDVPPDGE